MYFRLVSFPCSGTDLSNFVDAASSDSVGCSVDYLLTNEVKLYDFMCLHLHAIVAIVITVCMYMYTPGQPPQGFPRGGEQKKRVSIFDFHSPNLYKKKSLHIGYFDTTVWQCKVTASSSITT